MFKRMVALLLTMGLLGMLAGCNAPKPEPEKDSAAQQQDEQSATLEDEESTEPVEPAELPAPPNADKPLPDSDSIKQLKQGELLFSTEYQAENAEQILVSFILSADGKSARNFNVYMRNVTVINDPDVAPSPYVSEAASSTGMQSTDVVGGHLEYNDDYVHLILDIDGETAAGSCSISHYSKGLSFDDMPKIEGMEYQDVPPSLISIAELPVTFAVAARG